MTTRFAVLAVATCFSANTPLHAQTVPEDCSAPASPDAVRLALFITDLDGLPFSGIASVSVRTASEPARDNEAQPAFLQAWYCSDEVPLGSYTVEVRALTFDCVAVSLAATEAGLIVRLIRLRPDPWRPAKSGRGGLPPTVDPHLVLVERLSAKRCGVAAG
jgi:hypothetical protein